MVSPLTNGNPSFFRTQVQDTYTVCGQDVTGAWDIVYSTLEDLVVTTTDDTLPAAGLKLGKDKNVLIYADRLTICREIHIPGKAIKIVCFTLSALPPSTTANSQITISTTPPDLPQKIIAIPPAYTLVDAIYPEFQAQCGADGLDALDATGSVAMDDDGTVHPELVTANQGASAGPIELRCYSFDDNVSKLKILAEGARGGPGIAAQSGAPGSPGLPGNEYHVRPRQQIHFRPKGLSLAGPVSTNGLDDVVTSSKAPTIGGDGGNGGRGLMGFPGGSGGPITFYFPNNWIPHPVDMPVGANVWQAIGSFLSHVLPSHWDRFEVRSGVGGRGDDPAPASGGTPGTGGIGMDIYELDSVLPKSKFLRNTGTPVALTGTKGSDGPLLLPTADPAPTEGEITYHHIETPDQLGFDSAFWLKMLQKLRNLYFYCYPVPDDAQSRHAKEISLLGSRLETMMAGIPATTPPNPDSEDLRLADLRRQAERLHFYLKLGYTVFGTRPDVVPDLGFKALTQALMQTESTYKDVELAFHNAVASVDALSNSAIDSEALVASLQKRKAKLEGIIAGDGKVIADVASRIGKTESALTGARTALQSAISGTLQSQIQSQFSCGIKDVLSALQSLAFAPNEGMALVAGAQMLYNGATNIEGSNGVSIDKSLIISKIVTLSTDIGASGSAAYAAAGKNLDNTALLTTLDDFETYLRNLPNTIPAATSVLSEIEDFKQQLCQRSALLFEYNATLHNLRVTASEKVMLTDRITAAQNGQSKSSDPTLVGLTSYLAAMYQRLEEDAMALLYLAYQAFHCQFLQAPTTAFDYYQDQLLWTQGDTPAFSFINLETAISDLTTQKSNIESNTGWTPSHYGVTINERVSLNIVNKEVLSALAEYSSVNFTTVPDSPAGKFQFVPLNTTGFADIRVTRVLPRVIGATTNSGKLDLTITHGGSERFVTVDGDIVGFSHQPIVIPLTLDLSLGDSAAYPWDKYEGLLTGADFMEPGIFTVWSIDLTPGDTNNPNNLGLDLSKVTAIHIDFCGTYRKKN